LETIMTIIIAGRFEQQDEAQQAVVAVQSAGFASDRVTSFYVNPPGQHDLYPVGGDRDKSPGAENSDKGSAEGIGAGGAVGAAIGVAASPVIGPVGALTGALVGAHIGSLMGSLSRTDEAGNIPDIRHSGLLVAVAVDNRDEESRATDALRAAGGNDLERASGHIVDGDWTDFDPLSTPAYL
jgi:hypothetical protein